MSNLQEVLTKIMVEQLASESSESSGSTVNLESSPLDSSEELSKLGRKMSSVAKIVISTLWLLGFWMLGMIVALFVAPLWLFLALTFSGVFLCLVSLHRLKKALRRV